VLADFRDDAWFATEQFTGLGQKLTVIGGFRADRSSANGDRNKRTSIRAGRVVPVTNSAARSTR